MTRLLVLLLLASLAGCGLQRLVTNPQPSPPRGTAPSEPGPGAEPAASTGESGKAPSVAVEEDSSRLEKSVMESVREGTVLIGNFEGGDLKLTGTGFVVGDGKKIVTNKHIATGTDEVPDDLKLVFWSGTTYPRLVQVRPTQITLYGSLPRSSERYHLEDLALISIGAVVAKPLAISRGQKLLETMPVWAFGYPHGTKILTNQDLPSSTVHSLRVERVEVKDGSTQIIQLSGSPTFGNSGGPVVDREGRVVGVLHSKASGASIIFAIPSSRLDQFVQRGRQASGSVADLWTKPIKETPPSPPASEPRLPARAPSGPKQDFGSALNTSDISEQDLAGLSPFELTVLRNEPFARRGYIFKRADLRRHFSGYSWYVQRTRNLQSVEKLLTRREARNVDFVKRYQVATGQEF